MGWGWGDEVAKKPECDLRGWSWQVWGRAGLVESSLTLLGLLLPLLFGRAAHWAPVSVPGRPLWAGWQSPGVGLSRPGMRLWLRNPWQFPVWSHLSVQGAGVAVCVCYLDILV